MADLGKHFKFLKKISSKVDKLFLGDMVQSNNNNNNTHKNSYLKKNSNNESMVDDYLSNNLSHSANEFNENVDDFNDKYSKYIYLDEFEDSKFGNFEDYSYRELSGSEFGDFEDSNYFKNSKFNEPLDSNFNNLSSNKDYEYDCYEYNDYESKNSFKEFDLKNLKNKLLNSTNSSKKNFGTITIILIVLILCSSIFYFGFFQPFQNELSTEKNAKLNELNTLYKGPLSINSHYYTLKNQIEDAKNVHEVKSVDVLRMATSDWRKYHVSKINAYEDPYGRVMMSYAENESKKSLMSSNDAKSFVSDNDGKVLSNILFGEVDTVIVPISINRLQATGGLISVGSIVDVYSLSNNSEYDGSKSNLDNSDSSNSNSSTNNVNSSESDGSNNNLTDSNSNGDNDDSSSNNNQQSTDLDSSQPSILNSNSNSNSKLTMNEEPDVSGATVLAILRSKDSGIVDSSVTCSTNRIKGNSTFPTERSTSFSADVEELLKSAVFKNQDNDGLSSYLNNYGIQLSNYERLSNIGELDTDYLILLEIPRSDVSFMINNMDNVILTIPTEYAPNWAIDELKSTYYNQLNYTLGN